MDVPQFAYCRSCAQIRPIVAEELKHPDTTGRFRGGDIVCTVCHYIICTLYETRGATIKV